MANILGELFSDIAEAIRGKTGDTGTMKPAEFPEKIAGIEAGGGSSGDVRYVTFMSHDGTVELGKKAVAVGDDCADPIARGVFATPTRESDVQYNYTFAGWSTVANGGLDGTALKAVEEDRTVYANYAAVLRTYAISFYDGDTLLTTKTVAYGSVPSYIPTKDGYDFVSWNPEPVAVTGDASYTAVWKVKATFATATWAEISAITTAGTSADSFAVGDTRNEVLTYSDGTTEEIELVIAKIRDDGTIVLAFNHALATLKPMHSSITSAVSNYFSNDLGNYIADTIVPALSAEFSAVVREQSVLFSKRKLRLLSNYNVYSAGENANTNIEYESLPLFATANNRIRKNKGTAVSYWLSSYTKSGSYYKFDYVTESGLVVNAGGVADGLTTNRGVVLVADV